MSDDQPFIPLGWEPGTQGKPGRRYVFRIVLGGEIVRIAATQLARSNRLLDLHPDRAWWKERYPSTGPKGNGIRWRDAAAALMTACRELGRYRGDEGDGHRRN